MAERQKSVILSHGRCQQTALAHDRYIQGRVNMLIGLDLQNPKYTKHFLKTT